MNSSSLSRAATLLAATALAAVLAFWYFAIRTPPIPRRPLRIGFEHVPPVQIRTANGPSGLAIDTVNVAAKRAGISLQWVETGTSSDEAFRRGLVDLWPVMADLPERRQRLHITRPWLNTSHDMVLRLDAARPDSGFTGPMAVFKMPLHVRLARQEFPQAQLIQVEDVTDVLRQVCLGTAAAGILEGRAALAELRDRPSECAPLSLRMERLPALTTPLGVGSTFESAGAADKIRAQIGDLYRDGTLSANMAKYSYHGLDETGATYELMEAAERARWVAWGIGALGIALALTLWQAASLRQRRRSEAALRLSEERFRAIFQQAAVGVAQITLDRTATLVNDRYCQVLGYTREELLGTSLLDKTHPDDRSLMLASHSRLTAGEITSDVAEIRCLRKDGESIWIRVYSSLVRNEHGHPKYFVSVLEDITERKHAEAALRESEQRFRKMADTVPAMIWIAGPDKLCTFFNQGWLSFVGVSMDQALGNGWSDSVHPDDRDACYAGFSAAFDARRSFHTECRLRRADGEYRWVLAMGVPRFESNGELGGFEGCCTDITELKRAQEEALSRQKLEGLGVLAGGIAHDFNNLLGSILATAELVTLEIPPDSAAHDGLESIKLVADRAAEIVGQMLDYAGQEKVTFEPFDLAGLVNGMLEFLKVSISKRALLAVDLPANLPPVLMNAAQLRRVVMNLITNASEALGEKEGVISVAVSHVRPAPELPGSPRILMRDHLRLTVRDSGCGMKPEIQAKIFDPFFTTKFAGRGMGLSAVQGIVRDHGGIINVQSSPGLGSCFDILLPCVAKPALPPDGQPTPVSAASATRGNVLVIEDENELRQAVSALLRKDGFAVLEAGDGLTGVALFRTCQPLISVVVLDLTLPGMSGREVLDELNRINPDVKVIVTTAYSHNTAQQTLGSNYPWLYVQKPYRMGAIAALLRNACQQARAAVEGPA